VGVLRAQSLQALDFWMCYPDQWKSDFGLRQVIPTAVLSGRLQAPQSPGRAKARPDAILGA
jgi:hypothetical protein